MNERHSSLDRLEARIEYQAARIDTLYAVLEARGILHRPMDTPRGDALFDELEGIEDAPLVRETRYRPTKRRVSRLRLGNATGV